MPDSSSLLAKIPKKNAKTLGYLGNPQDSFDLTKHPAFTGLARQWQTENKKNVSNVYEEIENHSVCMTVNGL